MTVEPGKVMRAIWQANLKTGEERSQVVGEIRPHQQTEVAVKGWLGSSFHPA